MIPAAGNSRYDTEFHLIRYAYEGTHDRTGNDVAPYRLALKSHSSGTITSVKYNLEKAFEKNRDFSISYGTVIFFNVYVFQRIAASASRRYGHILWQTAKP